MFFEKNIYRKNYFDLILCATWIKPLFFLLEQHNFFSQAPIEVNIITLES